MIGVTDGHVPHPKVSKPFANAPVSVGTSTVFDDGHVTRFTCWCTLVVGFEGVVLLVDHDVNGVVAGELTHFHQLDVGKLVPVCVAALVAGNPDVLTFVEVPLTVVVEDGHGVRSVGGDSHVVETIAVEIANGDIHGVTVGRVGS